VVVDPADLRNVLESEAKAICSLARVEPLRLLEAGEPHPTSENSITMALDHVSVFIPMKTLVDVLKERGRLDKEFEECERNIARLHGRLTDSQFLAKAPNEVVGRERERLKALQERSVRIQELLAQLPR
jgi:valyl-tRNA synthetase